MIGQEFLRPPAVRMAEDEYILGNPRITAQFHRFIQTGNGKAVGPVFRKGTGQFDGTVAIGIGLTTAAIRTSGPT